MKPEFKVAVAQVLPLCELMVLESVTSAAWADTYSPILLQDWYKCHSLSGAGACAQDATMSWRLTQ
jgi:hypothetical protein